MPKKIKMSGKWYNVVGDVQGKTTDGSAGWGFYVVQEEGSAEDICLVPFDAGLCPFDLIYVTNHVEFQDAV